MSNSIELTTKAGVKIAVNAVTGGGGGGGGVTAHSALTGLTTGDDHTQYQRSEATYTSSASYTVTDESVLITAGSAVTLPGAQAMAGRVVGVGAAAQTVAISPAGTDTMFDDPGNPYSLPSGNGISFVAVQISGNWGWAIYTRNGPAFDMPKWVGESLAEGKVLRVNSSGAPAWASIAAADVPNLAASKVTSGTFDTARLASTGTADATTFLRGDGSWAAPSATVADGAVTTAKIADGAVTSAKIADGTIVDADVSASAAIASTKISGLATVATSGSASDLSAGTVPSARLSTKAVGGQGAGSTVTEPTSLTSLLTSTVTLPACAAGDVLLIDAGITFTQNNAGAKNYTFAVKLGATTMLSTVNTVSQSANARTAHLRAVIRVLTTTSQAGAISVVFNTNTSGSSGVATGSTGTATETISSALALDVLASTSASGTTQTFQLQSLSVNKVAA